MFSGYFSFSLFHQKYADFDNLLQLQCNHISGLRIYSLMIVMGGIILNIDFVGCDIACCLYVSSAV